MSSLIQNAVVEVARPCTDRLTVLRHNSIALAKTWLADGAIQPYDRAKHFTLQEITVSGIHELSMHLSLLEDQPLACLIRGRYVGDELARQRDPEFKRGFVRRTLDYFDDQPLHSILIEVDKFEPRRADPIEHPDEAVAEFVSSALPEAFHGISHHWQLSNSAGHAKYAGQLRVHIWFVSATPYTSAQIKAWAGEMALPIDSAVLNTVQVHYTAAPVFEPGVADPVLRRSGFAQGAVGDSVQLVFDETMLAQRNAARGGRGQRLVEVANDDPIAQSLAARGLVKSRNRDGGLNIECPFADEHTGESAETSTVYWPPHTGGHAVGNFKCLHSHCSGRGRGAFLARLDVVEGAEDFDAETPSPANPASPACTALPTAFPGPMAAVVGELLDTAPKPQPALTVLAVLIGMAAACGGHFRLPGGGRLNLYGLGVGDTGCGKDHTRRGGIAMADAAGAKIIGKPASGEGLEDALVDREGMLVEVDEIGHMFAASGAKGAPAHLISLSANLLKLFSAGGGAYHARVRAAVKGTTSARRVLNPAVSLLGFTTPHSLGSAVGSGNVADGTMGRMLFAFGDGDVAPRRTSRAFALPSVCAEAATAIRHAIETRILSGSGGAFNSDINIAFAADAAAELDRLLVQLDGRARQGGSLFEKSLRVRSYEKVERVSGVLAVWDAPSCPVITLDHVQWAAGVVDAADNSLVRFATEHMHESKVLADAARVLDVIRRVLTGELVPDRPGELQFVSRGYAPRSLVLRRSKLPKDDMDRAVEHLKATGDIRIAQEKVDATKGGSRDAVFFRLGEGV